MIQNVTRTFETTRIKKMAFLSFFEGFSGHKVHISHGIELKIAGNMYFDGTCRSYRPK